MRVRKRRPQCFPAFSREYRPENGIDKWQKIALVSVAVVAAAGLKFERAWTTVRECRLFSVVGKRRLVGAAEQLTTAAIAVDFLAVVC